MNIAKQDAFFRSNPEAYAAYSARSSLLVVKLGALFLAALMLVAYFGESHAAALEAPAEAAGVTKSSALARHIDATTNHDIATARGVKPAPSLLPPDFEEGSDEQYIYDNQYANWKKGCHVSGNTALQITQDGHGTIVAQCIETLSTAAVLHVQRGDIHVLEFYSNGKKMREEPFQEPRSASDTLQFQGRLLNHLDGQCEVLRGEQMKPAGSVLLYEFVKDHQLAQLSNLEMTTGKFAGTCTRQTQDSLVIQKGSVVCEGGGYTITKGAEVMSLCGGHLAKLHVKN